MEIKDASVIIVYTCPLLKRICRAIGNEITYSGYEVKESEDHIIGSIVIAEVRCVCKNFHKIELSSCYS